MIEMNVLLCATAETPWLKKDTEETQRLERCFEGLTYVYRDQGLVSLNDVKKADIIIGYVPVEMLPNAKNLKWLHLGTADVRGYDKADLYENDFVIVTRGEAFAAPEAAMEKVLDLMAQYFDGDDLDGEIELN